MGMAVVVLLKMDRVDLAAKKLAHMVAIDDDSVISQLCLAWVHLAQVCVCVCVGDRPAIAIVHHGSLHTG